MLVVKKSFQCDRCWKYSPKIKCGCSDEPLVCIRPRPDPQTDFDAYRKWDEWYVEFYLMEFDTDPEAMYEIGSSDRTQLMEKLETTRLLKSKSKKIVRPFKHVAHFGFNQCPFILHDI